MAAFGDRGERQHQRALRRDVIDDGERRLRANRSGERLHDVIRRAHRVRHLRHAHGRAPLARGKHHGPRHTAIAEIRDEDLVVGPDRPGAKNRVRAGRRVVDEHEVVTAHANELADGVGRLPQPGALGSRMPDDDLAELPQQIPAGIALDVVTDAALGVEYWQRRDADRAVIQIREARLERPLRP